MKKVMLNLAVLAILLVSCICFGSTPLTIPNPSFEDPVLALGGVLQAIPKDWVRVDPTTFYEVNTRRPPYSSASTCPPEAVPTDGDNICWRRLGILGAPLEQVIEENTIYTVEFDFFPHMPSTTASYLDVYFWAYESDLRNEQDPNRVQLSRRRITDDLTQNEWQRITITWSSTDVDRKIIGKKLAFGHQTNRGGVDNHTGSFSPNLQKVFISESNTCTVVNERGKVDTYDSVLLEEPSATVVITAKPDFSADEIDLGAGAGNPISLTFTPENYYIPQTVTVMAVNDLKVEGLHTSIITHSSNSVDSVFDETEIDDVTVAIVDNDRLGDINCDGIIGINDMRILAHQWLACCSCDFCMGADLTGVAGQSTCPEGKVDFHDFNLLSSHWHKDSLPALMRNTLGWLFGETMINASGVKDVNANVVHCWPSPPGISGPFKPLSAVKPLLDCTWRRQVDVMHEAGIKVYASGGSTGFNPEVFQSYNLDPELYYARDVNGAPQLMLSGSYGSHNYTSCYNNPYWFELQREFALMLADAGFDGMWYDVGGYSDGAVLYCQCSNCQSRWHQYLIEQEMDTQTPLPTRSNGTDMSQLINRRHLRWRWDCWVENWGTVLDFVKQHHPHFVFSHNMAAGGDYCLFLLSETDLYDYVHWEEWGHGCAPYSNIAVYLAGLAVGESKPVILVQNDKPRRNLLQHRIFMAEGYAAGGIPQDAQSYWGTVPGTKSISTDYYNFVETYEDYYTHTDSMANVAVVLSWWSKALYERANSLKPAYWLGQMLMDMHVPFDYIIAEKDLADPQRLLDKYKTVILPDLACISDQQISTLSAYLNEGGGIIATYNTGKYDDELALRNPTGLSLITGQSVVDRCQLSVGKGRFAYFADYLEKDYWDNNPRDFAKSDILDYPTPVPADVSNILYWVFNDSLPLQTNAELSTSVILKQKRNTIFAHLVNYNVYPDGKQLTPDQNIQLKITIPNGRSVNKVTAISPDFENPIVISDWSQNNQILEVNIEQLFVYTVLIVSLY